VPFVERPGGARLYYESHGDGPPLLLLEGMGGDIPGWRRNIPTLATRHRVIAYDHRGNGRSTMADEAVTMSVFVDDAAAMLDEIGAEQGHLYGQSFGGMVAIEAALTHPDRVRSLVLACTHAGPRRATHSAARAAKSRPYELLYSERFAREHPEHVAEDLRVGSGTPQQAFARRRQWEAMQDWDAWDRLGGIACPTLILHGTEDRLVPVENARRMAERIPGARLALLEGAGHLYHSEQPEAADAAVLAFLADVEARV
jgi:3-oxoadipate enol-lactonase